MYVGCVPSDEVGRFGFQDITRYSDTNVKVSVVNEDGNWKVIGFKKHIPNQNENATKNKSYCNNCINYHYLWSKNPSQTTNNRPERVLEKPDQSEAEKSRSSEYAIRKP